MLLCVNLNDSMKLYLRVQTLIIQNVAKGREAQYNSHAI